MQSCNSLQMQFFLKLQLVDTDRSCEPLQITKSSVSLLVFIPWHLMPVLAAWCREILSGNRRWNCHHKGWRQASVFVPTAMVSFASIKMCMCWKWELIMYITHIMQTVFHIRTNEFCSDLWRRRRRERRSLRTTNVGQRCIRRPHSYLCKQYAKPCKKKNYHKQFPDLFWGISMKSIPCSVFLNVATLFA